MTIDTLLTEISERGWLLNNLFQFDNGDWLANLRTDTHYTQYGRGRTPLEALSLAIDAIETAKEFQTKTVTYSIDKTPSTDLSSILAKLQKPTEPIKRRI
jgi:hypothetical protein